MTDTVHNLSSNPGDCYPAFKPGTPRSVAFVGTPYKSVDGQSVSFRININIEDGDVLKMIEVVKENGGIGGNMGDGTYCFIPWPCAAVEVRDL